MKIAKNLGLFIGLIALLTSCKNKNGQADAYGNFEAVEIVVSSLASGQLVDFQPVEGDQLAAGQVVGLVDTTDLALRISQVKAQQAAVLSRLESVRAQKQVQQQQLANARTDKNRIISLFNDGAATAKQKDDIEGAIALIEKQISATEAQIGSIVGEAEALGKQVDQVRESIRKSAVINPVKGTVLTKYVNMGEVVVFGKALYKLADLSSLELKVYISGRQLSGFVIGQPVKVYIDQQKDQEPALLDGTVSWISPSAEFTPKTIQTREERVDLVYAMKVRVKNDGRLKIGMPGEINRIQ
ncbi:MAG: HlyD family efflux transporter periplasmic adaptor subunit [Bacteroidetes bacterium]|nr:HlyD family efflux transporter periplasmic adaptor subunit [Bacteroidota bacterium]